MTYDDIITQTVFDAGDTSTDYTTAALRWVNMTRNKIAARGPWQSEVRSNIYFTTAAATTTGIYVLQDQNSNKYSGLKSDSLFDKTNEQTLRHESLATTWELDHDRTTTGKPNWWADAGLDSNGEKTVQLWPVPSGTYEIYFIGKPKLADITDTSVSVDPYFGPVLDWSEVMSEGVRLFHDLNDNSDPAQIVYQRKAFDEAIKVRKATEKLTVTSTLKLEPVNAQTEYQSAGRFDPSVYDNR